MEKKNKIAVIFKILATGETRNETIFPFSLPGKGEGLNQQKPNCDTFKEIEMHVKKK